MRRRLALTIAIAAMLAVVMGAIAVARISYIKICAPNLRSGAAAGRGCDTPQVYPPKVDLGLTPTTLSAHEPTPVSFTIQVGFRTTGGAGTAQIPRKLTFDFDRHGFLDTSGLPACGKREIINLDTDAARGACRDAIVGHGTATLEIENAPVSVPLSMFNGGARAGTTKVLIHAASPALPGPVVVPVRVTSTGHDDFGLEATLLVPPIAEGAGSLVGFRVKVGRRFAREGRLASYTAARCPRAPSSLKTGLTFVLTGGTQFTGSLTSPCTPHD